jgi:hypothetical protein
MHPPGLSLGRADAYLTIMRKMLGHALIVIALATTAVTPAPAQFIPPLPEANRIPAPLPPPPQPPVINGFNGIQGPPPGVAETKPLISPGDRATNCLHEGAASGLRGGRLSRYVRRCGNSG